MYIVSTDKTITYLHIDKENTIRPALKGYLYMINHCL